MNFLSNFYKKLADTKHLTDEQLHTRMKWTKGLVLLSTVSLLGWGAFGIAGAVALGLKAAGYPFMSAAMGASSLLTGAGMAFKSSVSLGILSAIHVKFKREKTARGGDAKQARAPAKAASASLLSRMKKLGANFNVFARKKEAQPIPVRVSVPGQQPPPKP